MAKVIGLNVSQEVYDRWSALAEKEGKKVTAWIKDRVESPIIPQCAHAEIVPPIFPDDIERIIAEKDAEIARLEKRIEATSISVRHGKRLSAQIKEASDAIFAEKSPQVLAREQGLKNAAGGVEGHKLNCRCNLCADMKGKK